MGISNNGRFSIKSAYHFEHKRLIRESDESSKGDEWKPVWGLKIQEVVKHFLWKACVELLLTRQNLLRRKVIDSSLCPICKLEGEATLHALWSCLLASDVWAEGGSLV